MTSPSLKTVDGELIIIAGASRCGKTAKTARELRKHRQAFIWDIDAQWHRLQGFKKVTTFAELKQIAVSGRSGKFAFVYSGEDLKGAFEKFCQCVFHYVKYFGACAVVAEELADVTSASKAPLHWGILLRRGLKRNLTIYAISQRWAEADKTAIGNATQFYCFMQNGDDVVYMHKKTRIPLERLESLRKLEFIHYIKAEGVAAAKGGKVAF
jgi:hypothetical protein